MEDDRARTPWHSFLLAYAAMVPIGLAAVVVLVAGERAVSFLVRPTIIWAAALLCFFAGVRRGLSFRQAGGPAIGQLGGMLWLFVLGVAALLSPSDRLALVVSLAGFVTLAVADPEAAAQRRAPRYFSQLRPPQMAIPILGLLILLIERQAAVGW